MTKDYEPTLQYRAEDRFAPIPPQESALPTIIAEPWHKVKQEVFSDLEAMRFDPEGNLWYAEAGGPASRMHRIDIKTKEDVIVYEDPLKRGMSAINFHKDGRLFLASVGPTFEAGYIFTMNPDGTNVEVLMEGPIFNDMIFDSKGGFYYTHFHGNVDTPDGGVYYVSPDFKKVTPLLPHLQAPNGIALSKDEKTVWISETCGNRLLKVQLTGNGPTDIVAFGVKVPYYFTGSGGADSICIDDDDNVYVAMYEQGRVMVFNKAGWPIGQILLAGRETGDFLGTTHPAISIDKNEVYICTNDVKNGAWLFKAESFAPANKNDFMFK